MDVGLGPTESWLANAEVLLLGLCCYCGWLLLLIVSYVPLTLKTLSLSKWFLQLVGPQIWLVDSQGLMELVGCWLLICLVTPLVIFGYQWELLPLCAPRSYIVVQSLYIHVQLVLIAETKTLWFLVLEIREGDIFAKKNHS